MIDWAGIIATNGQTLLVNAAAALGVIAFHGWSIAFLARLLGDRGPGHDGRLSLNPFQHLEPAGFVAAIFFRIGWIRPVEADHRELKGGAGGLVLLVGLSLAALVALALALDLARGPLLRAFAGADMAVNLIGLIEVAVEMLVLFAVLNLLPLPPLTGGMLLAVVAPRAAAVLRRHQALVAIALALGVATGVPGRVSGRLADALAGVF
ncbi:hypothetical protein HMH01_05670 [Halovulum dunhuangense]|uniref:Zn-dependent protease n=1 Tax=Halovulum dunhuangense TaxID=1505036 RepID=A0A849L0Y4_9RHOB|nr:hypothetical protein [Halovulum dunhuangense]NNU79923.1 hypothetical protein [Halovulum dunhuangense]